MKRIIICAAVAAVTLSSCGLYSKYEGTTSVDKAIYGGVAEERENGATLGDIEWSDLFTDTQLRSYIAEALESNSDLKMAKLRVEQSEASLVSSRLAYLPSVNFAPQGSLSGLVESGSSVYKSYTLPIAASWEVDLFGRITNTKLRTKMLYEQQQYVEQATRTEIVAAVANVYYTIAMLEEQLAISRSTEQSWEESYRTAKAMMDAGMMNQTGVSQIEAALYSVKISVAKLEDELTTINNTMCSLLGISPTKIVVGSLTDSSVPEDIMVGVPLQMLSSRPDVMAAESALAASFYSKNIARSALYPSLSLTGSLGWSNSFGSIVLDPADFIYSVVGQLVQPLFNRGLTRAQIKVAKADLEIARISFEQKLLDAGIEVNNSLRALQVASSNSSLYVDQVAAMRLAADQSLLMMENGSVTYLDVLTSQQSYYNSQLGEVSNRFEELQSLVSLYKSLGGGRF
ncbi:MAG: TolC family protein [Rikenellaceae bacterium]